MLEHEFIAVTRSDISDEITYDFIKNHYCVRISDEIILNNFELFKRLQTQWDEFGNFHAGLNYHGITIVLIEDLPELIDILQKLIRHQGIIELMELCQNAITNKSYIVHFGI